MKPRKTIPALTATQIERFNSKISVDQNCWVWNGYRGNGGYGYFSIVTGLTYLAHRVSWTLHKGQVPEGLQLDHLCRNRACVNPNHLEPVTAKVNQQRGSNVGGNRYVINQREKSICKNGHAYTRENTYTTPTGGRRCIECHRQTSRFYANKYRKTLSKLKKEGK